MSIVTGLGTTWNLPNYVGELFTADPTQTPFLYMIGGLTGGKKTDNYEFPTAVLFEYPKAKQPEITEEGSAIAPNASAIARKQESNVVQIHQEIIELTYFKQSNSGRLSGINGSNQTNPIDEKSWQIQQKLIQIARDVEYSFLQGNYQKATAANVANKTRGMLELASTSSTIDASKGDLTKDMIKALTLEMANNGAYFHNIVLFAGAKQKQKITDLYEKQLLTQSRNVAGMNIKEIETDFCNIGVVWDRFMPDDSILIADIAHIAPIFQEIEGKGVFFEEELAKVGASDRIQIYGQIGLAHGPAFLHGSITNLA